MTDKIITDGVDVSGCRYYKESLNFGYMRIDSCKGYGFCIHNLPSREFIISPKYDIPRCHGQKFCYYKQLSRKTAECEELKAQLETYSKMLDNPEFKIALIDVRTGEREVWRKLGSKAQKYEQALQKIKEKCYYCSKRVVVGGVAMCVDDIEEDEKDATKIKRNN